MENWVEHPFPLIRGGGLFLICVGLGFLLGWLIPRWWIAFAGAGFALGIVASIYGAQLPPDLGSPTQLQVLAFYIAIAVEIVLIIAVNLRYKPDERKQILGVLFVVGLHFVIMGVTFGPIIALLGVLVMLNAGLGWRALTHVPIKRIGIIDSVLKIAFGVFMFVFYPM